MCSNAATTITDKSDGNHVLSERERKRTSFRKLREKREEIGKNVGENGMVEDVLCMFE